MKKSEVIEKLTEIEGNPEVFVESERGRLDPIYTVCPQKYQRTRTLMRSNSAYSGTEDCIVIA